MTTYTWNASADGSASVNTNWTPVGVPDTGDSVLFNATSVKNCVWDITGEKLLETFTMASGYSGVLTATQSPVSKHFVLSAGTVTGTYSIPFKATEEFLANGATLTPDVLYIYITKEDYSPNAAATIKVGGSTVYKLHIHEGTENQLIGTIYTKHFVIESGAELDHIGPSGMLYWKYYNTVGDPPECTIQGMYSSSDGTAKFRIPVYSSNPTYTPSVYNRLPQEIVLLSGNTASRTVNLGGYGVIYADLSMWSEHATYTVTLSHGSNYELYQYSWTDLRLGTRSGLVTGTGLWDIGHVHFDSSSSFVTAGGKIIFRGGLSYAQGTLTTDIAKELEVHDYCQAKMPAFGSYNHWWHFVDATIWFTTNRMHVGKLYFTGSNLLHGLGWICDDASTSITLNSAARVYHQTTGASQFTNAGINRLTNNGSIYQAPNGDPMDSPIDICPAFADISMGGTLGVIAAPVRMYIGASETADRSITFSEYKEFYGPLQIYSNHPTYVIALNDWMNSGFHGGQLEVGVRAIVYQGTTKWSLTAFRIIDSTAIFNQAAEIEVYRAEPHIWTGIYFGTGTINVSSDYFVVEGPVEFTGLTTFSPGGDLMIDFADTVLTQTLTMPTGYNIDLGTVRVRGNLVETTSASTYLYVFSWIMDPGSTYNFARNTWCRLYWGGTFSSQGTFLSTNGKLFSFLLYGGNASVTNFGTFNCDVLVGVHSTDTASRKLTMLGTGNFSKLTIGYVSATYQTELDAGTSTQHVYGSFIVLNSGIWTPSTSEIHFYGDYDVSACYSMGAAGEWDAYFERDCSIKTAGTYGTALGVPHFAPSGYTVTLLSTVYIYYSRTTYLRGGTLDLDTFDIQVEGSLVIESPSTVTSDTGYMNFFVGPTTRTINGEGFTAKNVTIQIVLESASSVHTLQLLNNITITNELFVWIQGTEYGSTLVLDVNGKKITCTNGYVWFDRDHNYGKIKMGSGGIIECYVFVSDYSCELEHGTGSKVIMPTSNGWFNFMVGTYTMGSGILEIAADEVSVSMGSSMTPYKVVVAENARMKLTNHLYYYGLEAKPGSKINLNGYTATLRLGYLGAYPRFLTMNSSYVYGVGIFVAYINDTNANATLSYNTFSSEVNFKSGGGAQYYLSVSSISNSFTDLKLGNNGLGQFTVSFQDSQTSQIQKFDVDNDIDVIGQYKINGNITTWHTTSFLSGRLALCGYGSGGYLPETVSSGSIVEVCAPFLLMRSVAFEAPMYNCGGRFSLAPGVTLVESMSSRSDGESMRLGGIGYRERFDSNDWFSMFNRVAGNGVLDGFGLAQATNSGILSISSGRIVHNGELLTLSDTTVTLSSGTGQQHGIVYIPSGSSTPTLSVASTSFTDSSRFGKSSDYYGTGTNFVDYPLGSFPICQYCAMPSASYSSQYALYDNRLFVPVVVLDE